MKEKQLTSRSSLRKNFLYLAQQYLFTKHHDATIKLMIKICLAGIFIATCSLALVISIMNGFEQATYKKMQSIYPDIIIQAHDMPIDLAKLQNPDCGPIHTAEQKYAQALLSSPYQSTMPNMLMLRAIVPQQESLVSNLESKIIEPCAGKLHELIQNNNIILGAKLAESLDLQIGDQAYILCCKDHSYNLCMKFKPTTVEIAGIFKTGIDDLDNNLALCHQTLFDQIFPHQPIDQIHIHLDNIAQEQQYLLFLKEQLHYDAYSWKELYPTLLAALKLEKWAMVLILGLIILVASMNIMSLINMYITQKKRDIAILLCLGMKQQEIKKIFTTMSVIIASIASCCGLIMAWIIGWFLKNYFCIKLPDNVYDTNYLPVQLELHIFCAIFILTIIISVIASLLATHSVQKINIVTTLKTP